MRLQPSEVTPAQALAQRMISLAQRVATETETTSDVVPDVPIPEQTEGKYDSINYLQTSIANYIIFGSAALGLLYAFYCYRVLQKLEMKQDII